MFVSNTTQQHHGTINNSNVWLYPVDNISCWQPSYYCLLSIMLSVNTVLRLTTTTDLG